MIRMVSLDTSTRITGYAYWENGELVEHGIIDLSKSPKEERPDLMCIKVIDTLKKYKPEIVVIEMTVVPNNAGTQRILSEIVGCVRGYCLSQRKSVYFHRLRPTEWRSKIKGRTKPPKSKKDGLKDWDIKRAKTIFKFTPVDDNEADACLIGEAYKRLFVY